MIECAIGAIVGAVGLFVGLLALPTPKATPQDVASAGRRIAGQNEGVALKFSHETATYREPEVLRLHAVSGQNDEPVYIGSLVFKGQAVENIRRYLNGDSVE